MTMTDHSNCNSLGLQNQSGTTVFYFVHLLCCCFLLCCSQFHPNVSLQSYYNGWKVCLSVCLSALSSAFHVARSQTPTMAFESLGLGYVPLSPHFVPHLTPQAALGDKVWDTYLRLKDSNTTVGVHDHATQKAPEAYDRQTDKLSSHYTLCLKKSM